MTTFNEQKGRTNPAKCQAYILGCIRPIHCHIILLKYIMVKLSLLVKIVSLLVLDSVPSVWSTGMANNITISDNELLDHSEYCVLNDSAIREKDGDGLLIIITFNDTGDWLLVTYGSNLFVFPSNGSNCEDDVYNPNIVMYAMQTFLYGVAFLLTTFIIILHLCFKELQTVFGILTILFCFFFNADDVILFVHNRYQFTHTVNDSGEVCTVFVFVYTRGLFSSNLHTSCTVLTEQDWRDIEPIIG